MDHWVIEVGFLCAAGHTVSLLHRDQYLEFIKLSIIDAQLSIDTNQVCSFLLTINHLHHFKKAVPYFQSTFVWLLLPTPQYQ